MDSPELRYLKAMQKVNQKAYMQLAFQLSDVKALLLILVNFEKAKMITEQGFLQGDAEQGIQKLLEDARKIAHQDMLSIVEQIKEHLNNPPDSN